MGAQRDDRSLFSDHKRLRTERHVGSSVATSAGSPRSARPCIIVVLTSRTRARAPKRDILDVVACGLLHRLRPYVQGARRGTLHFTFENLVHADIRSDAAEAVRVDDFRVFAVESETPWCVQDMSGSRRCRTPAKAAHAVGIDEGPVLQRPIPITEHDVDDKAPQSSQRVSEGVAGEPLDRAQDLCCSPAPSARGHAHLLASTVAGPDS
jgi:hypothetical protein